MRLGFCAPTDQADVLAQAGFEYLDVPVQQVLRGDDPDDDWRAAAPDPDKLALPMEAASMLLPAHHPVIGPQRDFQALRLYMQRVAQRAGRMGIQRLVFGSGAARIRPDSVSPEHATDQIAEFCRMAGDLCAQHEVVLVVEHLNHPECNTINTLDEERLLIDRVKHPYVLALVDAYHFGLMNDSSEALVKLGDRLRLVHVAEPRERREPGYWHRQGQPDKGFDFQSFFCLLQKVGYNERISVEPSLDRPIAPYAADCAAYLRAAWQQAQCVDADA